MGTHLEEEERVGEVVICLLLLLLLLLVSTLLVKMVPQHLLLLFGVLTSPAWASNECHAPFERLLDEFCVHVKVTAPPEGSGQPLRWAEARAECIKLGGDLAVVGRTEKLQAISHYIDKSLPAWANKFIFWAGGHRIGSSPWKWTNGRQINLKSHVWTPSRPDKTTENRYTMVVPVDEVYNRFYLQDYREDQVAPAFICEKGES